MGQKSNLLDMVDEDFISEVEQYCADMGVSLSTLGVRALNNSRFFERAKRQQKKSAEAVTRLKAYMAANPAQTKGATT